MICNEYNVKRSVQFSGFSVVTMFCCILLILGHFHHPYKFVFIFVFFFYGNISSIYKICKIKKNNRLNPCVSGAWFQYISSWPAFFHLAQSTLHPQPWLIQKLQWYKLN